MPYSCENALNMLQKCRNFTMHMIINIIITIIFMIMIMIIIMIIIIIKGVYYKMETIFINTENSKASELHIFRLNLTGKRNLKNLNKNIALANLSIQYTWKSIKSEYSNNKFKISGPTWNENFDLSDDSYSVADIQDYFEFIIKKHETLTKNPPIKIYPNTVKNRILFRIRSGYKLKLLTPEIMKLLVSTKKCW